MDLLLDSHVLVWWAADPSLLSAEAAAAIANPLNDVWASAASAWELAIKAAQGKLTVDVRTLFSCLPDRGIRLRGIGVDDGIDAATLAWAHRDRFDRVLVAQARRSALTMVTRDLAIREFEAGCLVA